MPATPPARLKMAVRGAVQGVGFRPFVFRLAAELGLHGWVNNSAQGVFLEVEGQQAEVEKFRLRLEAEKPPRSVIQSVETSWLEPVGHTGFEIRDSESAGEKTTLVLPDIAMCADCLSNILDSANRRYLYPFTNCTNCGPRFSIIESVPYDRANTSMKKFALCPECRKEYDDPADRRFHAQPNACPECGPHLELWDRQGTILATHHAALLQAAAALREGKIVTLKGIGGFQLLVDARNEAAVMRLRERKHREEKPFALMFPSLTAVRQNCLVSDLEARLVTSPESPIVILPRHHASRITHHLSSSVAPRNPNLGVMLPYTPLHHLLMSELGFPVVATSGNLSDEPICIDEREALGRLGGIADVFLVHDRPIVRPVDDSVVRVIAGREMILRRARGYAPLPVKWDAVERVPTSSALAVGAHLKNAVALSVGPQIFLSQHIGDLETLESYETFLRVINDFQRLYDVQPALIALDGHPDYPSGEFARDYAAQSADRRTFPVQHHLAHVFACMADNELAPPLLGIAWDGTGYGLDGTVWGGEFFCVSETGAKHAAHFRQFPLPGGDKAAKEPRRALLGLLFEMGGARVFDEGLLPTNAFSRIELAALQTMLKANVNSPRTSSAGRLFDAVAALIGLRQHNRFEGQAAMELEFALNGIVTNESYSLPLHDGRLHTQTAECYTRQEASGDAPLVLDWEPMITEVAADLKAGMPVGTISAKFHNALADGILTVARRIGERRVLLSGGCFQNRYLTERTITRLRQEGLQPYWHRRIPPNDGGIAVGQIVAALRGRE